MNKYSYKLATALVFLGAVISGGNGIAAKILLRELTPFESTFARLLLMFLSLIPFGYTLLPPLLKDKKTASILVALWCGNIFLFIYGIGYSSVIVSSLFYAATPVVVLVEQRIFEKKKVTLQQILGIVLSFVGATVIIVESYGANATFGTWYGNLMIGLAVCCYGLYLVYVQNSKEHISVKSVTILATFIGVIISGVGMLFTHVPFVLHVAHLSLAGIGALAYYALLGGTFFWLVSTWASKHGSALIASLSTYISLIAASILSIVFLGEHITVPLIIGGICILIGIMMTTKS